MAVIWAPISSVALDVWVASSFTSAATDRKALAGFSRSCCLNCGVESEKIGLFGNRLNQGHDLTDLGGRRCKAFDLLVGDTSTFRCPAYHFGSLGYLAGDFADRG